jgi:rhamnulokinase
MREWKFIGFDLGAESSRCVVAVLNDEKITLEEVHRFPTFNIHTNTGFHWDVLQIFNEMQTGLKKAAAKFGTLFDGISIDTWGVDYVLIDSEDRIIGYPYHYRDNRTDGMMDEAFIIKDKYSLYRETGNQAAQYNTLFQMLAEKKKKLNLLSLADRILLMPDFLTFMLTGVKSAEYTIASTTNLTNPYTRNWSWDLVSSFGLPAGIFPPIAEPGTRVGNLLPYIAESTGLDANIPVYLCASHDTASAFASVPAAPGDNVYLSSGTWSLLGVQQNSPVISREAMDNSFTNEGGINNSVCFLKNIIGLWPLQECRRQWLSEGFEYTYPELTELALKKGFVKAWVDLDDPRFLKAGNMPGKILSYLKETGQQAEECAGFITAVLLESLAFNYRNALDNLKKITGKKYNSLYAVGGGINNELLTQYISDATGLPVFAGPVEGAIIGNIGVQAIAAGAVAGINEWNKAVKKSFEIKEYKPVNEKYFTEHEEVYNKITIKNKK